MNVSVTVLNRGSDTDTFDLVLTADSDPTVVSDINLTLDGGATITVGLPWDTGGFTAEQHTLTATATVRDDVDPANNTRTSDPVTLVLGEPLISGAGATFGASLSDPAIATKADPLSANLVEAHDARSASALTEPSIATIPEPLSNIRVGNAGAQTQIDLTAVEIGTFAEPLRSEFIGAADRTAGRDLTDPQIGTFAEPLADLLLGNVQAVTSRDAVDPELDTLPEELSEIAVGGADATFGFDRLADPFLTQARIRSGSGIHLQGDPDDSTGAFLLVGERVHFVSEDGRFDILVAPGTYDITIEAPGYLPLNIVSISGSALVLNPGDILTIPELTLVYGDANGDGVIDIRDLSLGASNLMESSSELEAIPQ